jgi:hypothetical protein
VRATTISATTPTPLVMRKTIKARFIGVVI